MLKNKRRDFISHLIACSILPVPLFAKEIKSKNSSDIVRQILDGEVISLKNITSVSELEWCDHSSCKGVSLLHLIKGEMTEKRFSAHLVRINSNCRIDRHIHAEQYELHEVISGEGKGMLADKELDYNPGGMIIIPNNTEHLVQAGNTDMYLLAKFFPALL